MANDDETFALMETDWSSIKTLGEVLFQPYDLTLKIQRDDFTLGDLYGEWLHKKMNLEKLNNEMADRLLQCMKAQEKRIFENKVLLSAVYLDPRFMFLLTEEQQNSAVAHLCELYLRIQRLQPQENEMDTSSDSQEDEFAVYLRNAAKNPSTVESIAVDATTDNERIIDKLKSFKNRPTIHHKSNIREYWNDLKHEEPLLFTLASVVLSVPVAQVSVERAFSSLTYIFNNYRTRLSVDVLREVLLVRLNYELAPQPSEYVCEEDFEDLNDIDISP